VVRYETLVVQPEETVAAVCDFVGEEFLPEMLLMKDVPRFVEFHAEGRSPITTEHIGRYRWVVPEREVAFMQMLAGREMFAFGYPLQPLDFSPMDWVSFAFVECPSNLVRAFAWRSFAGAHYGAA
jgi:hypothetical protein